MNANTGVDRRAHGLFTGADFQVNAGIVLFLHWIKRADSIRLEGEDDIEIRLEDGYRIYAQAKAATHADTFGDGGRLREAFNTICENVVRDNCACAVYVTNDQEPFGKRIGSTWLPEACSHFGYGELPANARKKIDQLLKEHNVDAEYSSSIELLVFKFNGADDGTRYAVVRDKIRELIEDIGSCGLVGIKVVHGEWTRRLMLSAQDSDDSAFVSKADLVWVLAAGICESPDKGRWEEDYDREEVDRLCARYKQVIEDASNRFSTVTQVMSDFDDFCSAETGKSVKQQRDDFIREKASTYVDELGLSGCPENEASAVSGEVVRKILISRDQIEKVREVTHLADRVAVGTKGVQHRYV